jgi:deoxyadenosine/deoxycytidine kinase
MNNGLAEPGVVEKAPRVVEIIGPAGAGKTTLGRALRQRHEDIQLDIQVSRFQKFPFLVSTYAFMLPKYLRHYRHSRWFNWRETRSMVYLKAGRHVLRERSLDNGGITILDHGPIYRLSTLCEFGPEITSSQSYTQWWAELFNQWAATLDMIIWLDAPDEVLLERIHDRRRWHMIKDDSEKEAYQFLRRYRRVMERLIAQVVNDYHVALLSFNTAQNSVERIADDVVAAIDGALRD